MPKVLALRVVDKNRRSYAGFQWPELGPVEAPDWDPSPCCGKGLHGFLKGEGDGACANIFPDSLWQVVEVEAESVVNLSGKVKFPSCVVLYTGTQLEATTRIQKEYPGASVIGGTATAGYLGTAMAGDGGTATVGNYGTATAGQRGTATAGYYGTATAGSYGTATAGDYATATAGDEGTATAGTGGTATAGDYGTATAGQRGTATAGYYGTATAGYYGTATAGNGGTATAGDDGTATAGYRGTATAGDDGTATSGDGGTATAGDRGTILISYRDAVGRIRIAVGYPGENGIKPGVAYRLDENHNFTEVVK